MWWCIAGERDLWRNKGNLQQRVGSQGSSSWSREGELQATSNTDLQQTLKMGRTIEPEQGIFTLGNSGLRMMSLRSERER